MAKLQYQGTGRRKHSVARVRLIPGTGKITVNKKDLEDYFGMEIVKREVKRPFDIAGCPGKFDVIATVTGGGFTGQAGALRHGISRALCQADRDAYRAPLKAAGFLTRDSRMKERKKYGLKESKKSFTVLQALIETVFKTILQTSKDSKPLQLQGFLFYKNLQELLKCCLLATYLQQIKTPSF